jgi:hypothetical protein
MTSAEEIWAAYLDAVEHAARAVERQALQRGVPVLTPLPLPDAPWPATLEPRRRAVLEALEAAQETIRDCRDRTAGALAALPRPRRARGGYADGEHLDVLG